MGAPFSTLRDDFSDGVVARAWSAALTGSATYAETAGQLRLTLPSNTVGAHDAAYVTTSQYDLTGDSFFINIQTMVSTAVVAVASLQLIYDTNNRLQWTQVSGTIYARKLINGVSTDLFSAAWSATTYKYLRISESGGTITWWSSTNGTTWTSRATLANPFPITDLTLRISAACGNVATPGSFRLDDVNLILPALSTNWRWTQIVWPLTERFRTITLAVDTEGTAQAYVAFAASVDVNADPVAPTYWSGTADGGRELTSQATQTAAQDMAVDIPLDGRFDLPSQVEGKVIRVYHRSIDGNPYTLREVYPRRLVQSDDIEAESIRALHIAAGTISGDKITATFSITSKRIQTAYSLARVVLSGEANGGFIGYSDTDTYDPVAGTGTYQVLWSLLDGKFYAGAGGVIIDANGIEVQGSGTTDLDLNAYSFRRAAAATKTGGLYATDASSVNNITVWAKSIASLASQVVLKAESPSGQLSYAALTTGPSGGSAAYVSVSSSSSAGATVHLDSILSDATHGVLTPNLNVGGSLQGAGSGQIITTGDVTVGGNMAISGTVTQDAWTNVSSFSNSWASYGAGDEPGYYKDQFGVVHLRGMMKTGTINATAWTLPSGYRPLKRHIQAVASNGLYGTLSINTDGTVVPTSGSNVYFSFSGVSFPTH